MGAFRQERIVWVRGDLQMFNFGRGISFLVVGALFHIFFYIANADPRALSGFWIFLALVAYVDRQWKISEAWYLKVAKTIGIWLLIPILGIVLVFLVGFLIRFGILGPAFVYSLDYAPSILATFYFASTKGVTRKASIERQV